MKREHASYLNPIPLSAMEMKEIYRPDPREERRERIAAKAAVQGIRKVAKKHRRVEDL